MESAFELVSSRPDAVVLPMPTWRWRPEDFESALALARSAEVPTAVYNRFDSWDDPARGWRGDPAFTDLVHEYCGAAAVVAGPQLPLVGGPSHSLPLPYPPLLARRAAPVGLARRAAPVGLARRAAPVGLARRAAPVGLARRAAPVGSARRAAPDHPERPDIDVHFAGFYRDPGWAGPARDTRDRHHRGHLLAQLAPAVDPDRLLVRRGVYWESDPAEQEAMRDRSMAEIDRSAIVFAPAGYGYLTIRHADGWARGRVVLSEPVQRHILVPEPERWEAGEIVLVYEPSGRDLAEVVGAALEDPDRLAAIARAGWEYGRRWTDPAGQAGQLAEALASHCG